MNNLKSHLLVFFMFVMCFISANFGLGKLYASEQPQNLIAKHGGGGHHGGGHHGGGHHGGGHHGGGHHGGHHGGHGHHGHHGHYGHYGHHGHHGGWSGGWGGGYGGNAYSPGGYGYYDSYSYPSYYYDQTPTYTYPQQQVIPVYPSGSESTQYQGQSTNRVESNVQLEQQRSHNDVKSNGNTPSGAQVHGQQHVK
jgi:hypothetical protein